MLSPSLVILSEANNLGISLRVNSAKNLALNAIITRFFVAFGSSESHARRVFSNLRAPWNLKPGTRNLQPVYGRTPRARYRLAHQWGAHRGRPRAQARHARGHAAASGEGRNLRRPARPAARPDPQAADQHLRHSCRQDYPTIPRLSPPARGDEYRRCGRIYFH